MIDFNAKGTIRLSIRYQKIRFFKCAVVVLMYMQESQWLTFGDTEKGLFEMTVAEQEQTNSKNGVMLKVRREQKLVSRPPGAPALQQIWEARASFPENVVIFPCLH